MNRTTCLYFRTHGTSWTFMTNCFSRGRIETSFTNNRTNRLIQTTEKEQQVRFITYSYLRFLPVIICEVVVVVVYCQGIELVTATCYACMFYLTNRLHFSLRVYCNRSQMTFNSTKCTTREEVEWLDLTSSMCVSSNRSRTITNENHIIVSKHHTCVQVGKQCTEKTLSYCTSHYHTLVETESCRGSFYQPDKFDIVLLSVS